MRLMKRNQTAIYYCLYKGKEPLLDEDGNETSEYRVLYERPGNTQEKFIPMVILQT